MADPLSGISSEILLLRRGRSELAAEGPVLERCEQFVISLESAGDAVAFGVDRGDFMSEGMLILD